MFPSRPCLRLPPEVWLQCFRDCSSSDLCSICLVNRYFATIASNLRFRVLHRRVLQPHSVSPTGNERADDIEQWRQWKTSLEALAASPFASAVRAYTFCYAEPDDLLAWGHFDDTYIKTLPAFARLKRVVIVGLDLDAHLRRALKSLLELEDLVLSPDFVEDTGDPGQLIPLQRLTIANLPADSPHNREPFNEQVFLPDPSLLRELVLLCAGLTAACVSGLLTGSPDLRRPLTALTRLVLDLKREVLTPLHDMLALCPALRVLELQAAFGAPLTPHVHSQLQSLAAEKTALPVLHMIRAPAPYVKILVPGRPVHEVQLYQDLSDHPRMQREWRSVVGPFRYLAQATAPLRKLDVATFRYPPQKTPKVFAEIVKWFPQLEVLAFSMLDDADLGDESVLWWQAPRWRLLDDLLVDSALPIGIPEDISPGYRYDTLGRAFPPPPYSFPLVETRDHNPALRVRPTQSASRVRLHSFVQIFMNLLLEGAFTLPPNLTKLFFTGPSITDPVEEHAMILELERRLPRLEEIQLGWGYRTLNGPGDFHSEDECQREDYSERWVREGGCWYGWVRERPWSHNSPRPKLGKVVIGSQV
uniref:F-box domain-containing protein n=1 Tax=Mycena chlorophos TaxID=658473 RepID=A0ABQ0LPY6_MYCCL|nr:predicted protein [Mycena chlorophos]